MRLDKFAGMRLAAVVAVIALATFHFGGLQAQQSGTLAADPGTQTVAVGADATITLTQNMTVATTGAQSDVVFDKNVVELVDVSAGSAYSSATFLVGVAPQTKAQAIADANSTGKLENAAVYFIPGLGSVSTGAQPALVIKFKGKADGNSCIKLSQIELLDNAGAVLTATAQDGSVAVGSGSATCTNAGQVEGTPTPASSTTVAEATTTGATATVPVGTTTDGSTGAAPPDTSGGTVNSVAGVQSAPATAPVAGFGMPAEEQSTWWLLLIVVGGIAAVASIAITARRTR